MNQFREAFLTALGSVTIDRTVNFRYLSTGIWINYVNLPPEVSARKLGGGAENENNRISFFVDFSSYDETGKVSVTQQTSFLPRENSLRKKTANLPKIARYLADYLRSIARTVDPKFTHSK